MVAVLDGLVVVGDEPETVVVTVTVAWLDVPEDPGGETGGIPICIALMYGYRREQADAYQRKWR